LLRILRTPCLPGGRSGFRRLALPAAVWTALAALACGEPPEPPAPSEPPDDARTGAEAPTPPRRALWVLAEGSQRVLEHPERVAALLADAKALGATDLFVQVYRGGRAWFDSSHADAAPHRAARAKTSADPLAELLTRAHAADLRVHAWVNALSLARNREAPIAVALGPSAIQVDRRGRSLLDYPDYEVPQPDRRSYRMGTPGLYLDPGAPGVAEALVATFAELCARYPDLDGLHLDYIRYPDVLPFAPGTRFGVGLDFGYGEKTRARFRAETGREAPFGDSTRNADAWDAWRREQVDALVRDIAGAARAAAPEIELSAAVWSYADRAYLTIGQDWRRWLEDGALDFAVPMAYTLDDRLLRYQTEAFAGSPLAARIWVGLGTWLFAKEPAGALRQLEILRAAGVRSHALFSWDSIADAPPLRNALVTSDAE
jgi:uncharacterized lipoprotein YddW (UPF0748 family)